MGRHIPDLRRKLELLRRYGGYCDACALAGRLGVAVSTMNGWVSGSWKSSPESVPEKRMPGLVNALTEALSQARNVDDAQSLLLGQASALEDAFRYGAEESLERILEAEARQDSVRILRRPTLGLVEHDTEEDEAVPKVALDERFLLEFSIRHGGHLLALQNAQQTWAVVKFADGVVSYAKKPGVILLPGVGAAGIVYMRERNMAGPHRFILLVGPQPLPNTVCEAAIGRKALDWIMLQKLVRHYVSQPRHLREVHIASIIFDSI